MLSSVERNGKYIAIYLNSVYLESRRKTMKSSVNIVINRLERRYFLNWNHQWFIRTFANSFHFCPSISIPFLSTLISSNFTFLFPSFDFRFSHSFSVLKISIRYAAWYGALWARTNVLYVIKWTLTSIMTAIRINVCSERLLVTDTKTSSTIKVKFTIHHHEHTLACIGSS
jgi:hypothetical protein